MLNFHRFKHNINDILNPLFTINIGVEDTEHYFLLWHNYNVDRYDLLDGVNAIVASWPDKSFSYKIC